jgi:hypothetical protein
LTRRFDDQDHDHEHQSQHPFNFPPARALT